MRTPLALLLVLPLACGGKSKASEDATTESAQAVQTSGPLATLAGSWTGTVHLSGYGTVVASAILDAQGQGQYFATVSGGAKQQGFFRVLGWDGSYLLVESEGHKERIHATHKGDALWIDHAFIGQVKLERSDQ